MEADGTTVTVWYTCHICLRYYYISSANKCLTSWVQVHAAVKSQENRAMKEPTKCCFRHIMIRRERPVRLKTKQSCVMDGNMFTERALLEAEVMEVMGSARQR